MLLLQYNICGCFKKNWRENNYSYFGGFFRGGVVILFTMTENGVVDEPLAGAEGGLSDPEPDPLLDEILLDVDNLVQERSQLICICRGYPWFRERYFVVVQACP